jgi:hypothetical protein
MPYFAPGDLKRTKQQQITQLALAIQKPRG